jgi:cell division protease FtsH
MFVGANYIAEKGDAKPRNSFTYSRFIEAVNSGQIAEVTVQGANILGKTKQGEEFSTYMPYHNPALLQELVVHGVNVSAKPVEQEFSFWAFILPWMPLIFLIGLILYSIRKMQSGENRAMGFGRSNAKIVEEKSVKTTFDDVAGVEEAKHELMEIVDFLKEPQRFKKLGGKIPKGVLLVGEPGTGKTLLARAVAGEANVPFFSMAGSDFVEMFVGVGASRVRDLFVQAKKNSPSIVFIDEIDAVGRRRHAGYGPANEEREQTLNQLLVEMDGFDDKSTVIVLAATNRVNILDAALLRAGRFDRHVMVPLPDLLGRAEILRVHMKAVTISPDVDVNALARGTPGFSGSDLAKLVNEAALFAATKGESSVAMVHFDHAKDKVVMGTERRSRVMTDEEKKRTAFHEAGHAVVYTFTPGSPPIHKATIIPRGEALGMVVSLPERDQFSVTLEQLIASIMGSMGGKVAEEIIFGANFVTTGASADIKSATAIARRMVVEWGMSERLGFQNCDAGDAFVSEISADTSRIVDEEVSKILASCYEKTKALLSVHSEQLHDLAHALLDRETLSGEEVKLVCNGETLPPRTDIVQAEILIPAELTEPAPSEPVQPKRRRRKSTNSEDV